jgi:hypothetical protein
MSSIRLFSPLLCPLLALGAAQAHACAGRLHVEVQESGVYALDYAAIVAAQPGLRDCTSADLELTQRGTAVPLRVVGDDRGQFGPGSRIEWVGQALHGPQSWYDSYSTENVYQLGAAPGAHARVHDAAPAAQTPVALRRRVHLEQENLLLHLNSTEMNPGEEPDFWQWAKLTPIDAQPFEIAFDLADLDVRAANTRAALKLGFRGVSQILAPQDAAKKAIDHMVDVVLNGKPLATLEWDGRNDLVRTIELAPGALKEKDNRVSLRVHKRELPGDASNFIVDVVMFNWLEMAYPAQGDIARSEAAFSAAGNGIARIAAAQPPQVYGSDGSFQRGTPDGNGFRVALREGVEYFAGAARMPALRGVAAQDLRAADPGHDYLIVAHPTLRQAIEPLAQYHREHGLDVAVYDVDDVYDQFNDGIAHPRAIRDLVAWGTQHWQRKPRYLLLVGDASTDIHHDPRNGALNGSSYSLTAHPQPAQVLQGQGFVEMKSYAYPDAQRVRSRNLIPTWEFPSSEGQAASDNDFVAMRDGDFHPTLAVGRIPVVDAVEVSAVVEKTLAYLTHPSSGDWRRAVSFISTSELAIFKDSSDRLAADLNRRGYATSSIYTDATDRSPEHYQQARTALRANLDGGGLLVHFLGHGGSYIWRVGAMGDLFSLDDVSALNNAGRYPMVLAMTCFSAPFDNPTDDSIGERFLREANRGAVAVYAASWKNWPDPANSRVLIDELLKPGNRIGDAIVAAKTKMQNRDVVEMYNLLGDPALVLAQPDGKLDFAVEQGARDRRLLVRVPAADFGGNVVVDWLDQSGNAVASARYESRDRQFALTPPAQASDARIYAMDTRSGFSAFGGIHLLPPPAATVSAAPAVPAKTAPPAPSSGIQLPPGSLPDHIVTLGFENAEAAAGEPRGETSAR